MSPLIFDWVLTLTLVFLLWFSLRSCKQTTPSSTRHYFGFFDVLKGVAIIAVVAIHSTSLDSRLLVVHSFLDFAVPFFFIISGYLLHYHYRKTIDVKIYAKKIVTRIVIIYLLFVLGIRLFSGQAMNLQEIVLDIVLGRTNGGNYYFIPVLLSLYVLYPLLRRVTSYVRHPLSLAVVASFSLYSFQWLRSVQTPNWNSHELALVYFGPYLLYFVWGMVLSTYRIKDLTFHHFRYVFVGYVMFLITSFMLFSTLSLGFIYPLVAFMLVFCTHNISISTPKWLTTALGQVGKNSLVIYLIHTQMLIAITTLDILSTLPLLVEYSLTILFTVVTSYVFSRLFMAMYSRIPQVFRK